MAPRRPGLEVEITPESWPQFSEYQVAFLEKMFPKRCLQTRETVEDHLRYAGKVDLIAIMRDHVIGSPGSLLLSDDEEDALDDEAAAIALSQLQQDEPQ